MDLNNKVIEVINRDHGRKVKSFFKKNGVSVSNCTFSNTKSNLVERRFYGLRNNVFDCFSTEEVEFLTLTVIALPTQDAELDLSNKSTIIKPNNKTKVKNLNKQDTAPKPRYFVKLTEANYKILNQYLHKHWKDYIGYKDNWEATFIKKAYFCSESVVVLGQGFHTVYRYPDLPTDSLLTAYEFLSLLDIDLLNKYKFHATDTKEKETVAPTEDQPDFSAVDLIIMKHLLDSNIKFDMNDLNFYRSIFQLGYDYSIDTRVY